MSNYATAAAEAGDKYLETLAAGQDRIIEYVRASREFIPQFPGARAPSAPFAATAFAAAPFAVPSLKEVAEVQFRFAGKLLELQQNFYRRLYLKPGAKSAVRTAALSAGKVATSKAGATKARTTQKTKATRRPSPVA